MQIIVAGSLGVLPGCFGAFTAVSLYTHGIINFAGLVTAMIAATGDEAFIMFAMIPGTAVKIFILVFIIGIVSGLIINLFLKNKTIFKPKEGHFVIHKEESIKFISRYKQIIEQWKHLSFQRMLLMSTILMLIFSIFTNFFNIDSIIEKSTFIIFSLAGTFIIAIAPDHFLTKHLWEHIFRKHILKIFLWTFGALFIIHFVFHFINIESWIRSNQLIILMIAILIGVIPESGPHIIFITLFASGNIPFSILLANSIVQDGHGALPLLAESKKSFIALKLVNMSVGLIIGLAGYFIGF